jgi:serine/threonine protein kinase
MTSDDERSLSKKVLGATQQHLYDPNESDLDSGQTSNHLPVHADLPACPFAPGDLIGRYEMICELGTGGFGHVVQANDPQLRRTVAIKFPRMDRKHESREAFFEEGRSIARLKHPSIVPIYNVEETDDGLPFVVMEFVDGQTLSDVIRNDGMTYTQAISYLIQIAKALAFAQLDRCGAFLQLAQ